MADGVQGDDDEIFRGPLPPEDRLWRHPSEVTVDHPSPDRAPWGTALVSAAGGAFAVGAVWMAIGGNGGGGQLATQWVSLVPVESVAPLVIPADQWTDEVSRIARPGTVTVHTADGSTTIAGAVAVRDDGFYLTSGRAIGDHETVMIVTAGGDATQADVVGFDPITDVSVLHADGSPTAAVVAPSAGVVAGDAVAIIDPRDEVFEHVVVDETATIETVDGDWLVGVVTLNGPLGDTPAGSPVVDRTGAVVGVTAATPSDAPAVIVPIDIATDVAADLIEAGVADHARLGVSAIDSGTADAANVPGARVSSVQAGGPAETGGILEGDVVVQVDTVDVDSLAAMVLELRSHEPGDVIEVIVQRDNERVGCVVELASTCPADCLVG